MFKLNNKCKSYIIFNDEKEILKYDGVHNHFEQEFNAALSLTKYRIKKEIKKSSIPFNIKPKRVFNQISQDIGFICPEFKSIKSQIIRDINKQLPPNISSFEEIPEKHYLYITKQNENFMIFKNQNVIIFQSPFQAFLFKKYCDDLFVDGTFYIAPDFSYQVFITRSFVPELNEFYTTSFSILRNKEQEIYKIKQYLKKTYLILYNIENWNYYNNIEHITNNASESFNNYLCGLSSKKPTYFRLIYTLNNDVSLYPDTYERRMLGVWNKQKRKTLTKTNKIKNIIESYKKMESLLISNERNRSHIAGLWFECLINLNNKIN
ncbi:hypothetical protein LY90DRAFT_514337 [Neocallimastix californiae]|uniref:MULE transposase domain-containing protein n=1 Tax=Neocallimastix californiae TaxID=1754190 RepID=A0A1Y2ASU5_9FUNG|nr:hypothetical protein LY90DRAFT_514337 [Neocallimastix californiae]|eukprot:ORY25015.1 hypothetical protein LY90DRAFT_514337 [Neocallimastix californiae]